MSDHERTGSHEVAASGKKNPVGTILDAPLLVRDPNSKVVLLMLEDTGLLTLSDPQGRTVLEGGPCPPLRPDENPKRYHPARKTLFRVYDPASGQPILEVSVMENMTMLVVREAQEGHQGALLDASPNGSSLTLYEPNADESGLLVQLEASKHRRGSLSLVLDENSGGVTLGQST